MEKKDRRRGILLAVLMVVLFSMIVVRLYWIQMVTVRSFSREQADLLTQAQEQQSKEYVVDSGRGTILDRTGRPLTGERGWRAIVFPLSEQQVAANRSKMQKLTSILGFSYPQLVRSVTKIQAPQALSSPEGEELLLTPSQVEQIRKLKIPGVFVMQSDDRFSEHRPARQVIGRVERNPFWIKDRYPEEWAKGKYHSNSRVGVTGLESAFEPFLRGGEVRTFTYKKDGRGKPLNGFQVRVREEKDGSAHRLVTTLDKDVQRAAEQALDAEGVKEGAVVVQDISTGDVLAMASRPGWEDGNSGQNPWDNRALMEAVPGSIFKTVVAAAALDTGKVKPDETFVCKGELGRYGMRDPRPHGHGKQTFTEAYANSCNVVFAQVAERIGGDTINQYARKMGLGQQVMWKGPLDKEKEFRQLPREQTGMILSDPALLKDTGAVMQTAIGQRDVKMTPLQAANMVTALFHRGKTPNPRIVKEIQDSNGKVIHRFPLHILQADHPIGTRALEQVRMMMRSAVIKGTAQSLQGAKWALAAKTGTAQVGPKENRFNKWMIGFGPVERPIVVVSVVIRSVPDSKDIRAHTVFKRVMDGIASLEKTSTNRKS
ncbi:penicillin-binding protein 4B [Marinithermofilum abyssi]|uniref:Penicillin-binding protein 4B n=1 Tax=Marinithermofilum abyssi TaxID=1571185 RepID=A0A8J2VCR6_9BACL|nr:penicillin-binding protein 2 [Marinithermofilum abyssi]GGE13559.1 penicillin-binding protein 4B [Marinithermofilum abyssi]